MIGKLVLGCALACPGVASSCARSPSTDPGPGTTARRTPMGMASQGAAEAPGVAVVELFTSEGCSSCPPADDVLARLPEGAGVFKLAFHVDYWNELGWIDPFSSAEHSARQERYARAHGRRGLFTPQAIVNGTTSITGSEERELEEAIRSALDAPASVQIASKMTVDGRRTTVTFTIDPVPPGAQVNAALLENQLSVRIPRGENGGKTLRHERVVRAFVSATATAEGKLVLHAPSNMSRSGDGSSHTDIVVYVQDARTMAVLGATKPARR